MTPPPTMFWNAHRTLPRNTKKPRWRSGPRCIATTKPHSTSSTYSMQVRLHPTSPGEPAPTRVPVTGKIPSPASAPDATVRAASEQALRYTGLQSGTNMEGIAVQRVFIGSCTNARIEDLRVVAGIVKGRKVASSVRAMVVPGSGAVRRQAEREGIAQILIDSGFEWRQPGCSMCLAMNDDFLLPGERCASTTNRNLEGRQGRGGITHLMSPAMAAAAAITGCITDVRKLGETHV